MHDDLGWKNQTTPYILPRNWLYEWFSQFHSCGTYSVLSRSHFSSFCFVTLFVESDRNRKGKNVSHQRSPMVLLWEMCDDLASPGVMMGCKDPVESPPLTYQRSVSLQARYPYCHPATSGQKHFWKPWSLKGKVNHAPQSIGGCSSPSPRPWARWWRTTNVCVTRG